MAHTELLQIDDDLIDKKTGEIIEQPDSVVTEVLPKLCRRMRTLDRLVGFQEDFRNKEVAHLQKEIERISESVDAEINRLHREHNNVMAYAVRLVEAAPPDTLPMSKGKVRLHYPGYGVLGWATLKRESVDTSVYDAMNDAEKLHIQNQQKGAFRLTTKVTPDKKAIQVNLNNGVERPGFSLVKKVKGWKFKAE